MPDLTITSYTQKKKVDQLRYPYSNMSEKESRRDFLKVNVIEYVTPAETGNQNIFTGDFNILSAEERMVKKPLASILLPIPQSIQDSNGVRWGEDSLNPIAARGLGLTEDTLNAETLPGAITNATNGISKLGQDIYGQRGLSNLFFGSKIINALGGNTSFQGLISRTTGQVLNPNLELLFNGVTLRSFSFNFDLSPRNKREAQEIKSIIRTFKKNMSAKTTARTVNNDEKGLFISSPNVFQITYQTGDKDHEYLNQFKPMALKNMSVNYTGSGTYATYSDTSPVHYKMNLQFQELDPVYAEDYESDKGLKGVGY